jgi:hypothetical protein
LNAGKRILQSATPYAALRGRDMRYAIFEVSILC